jgi:hypothetical protein
MDMLFIFIGVIFAPIFEELFLRYPLKYTKNSLIVGFISFLIVKFFTTITAMNSIREMSFNLDIYEIFYYIAIGLLIFVATRFQTINNFLSKFWNKYLIIIVYVFAAYFAYNHFSLPIVGVNWLWLPIFVLPQFFTALYLSYIRLQVKFSYCIFLHMILNAVAFLPAILGI